MIRIIISILVSIGISVALPAASASFSMSPAAVSEQVLLNTPTEITLQLSRSTDEGEQVIQLEAGELVNTLQLSYPETVVIPEGKYTKEVQVQLTSTALGNSETSLKAIFINESDNATRINNALILGINLETVANASDIRVYTNISSSDTLDTNITLDTLTAGVQEETATEYRIPYTLTITNGTTEYISGTPYDIEVLLDGNRIHRSRKVFSNQITPGEQATLEDTVGVPKADTYEVVVTVGNYTEVVESKQPITVIRILGWVVNVVAPLLLLIIAYKIFVLLRLDRDSAHKG